MSSNLALTIVAKDINTVEDTKAWGAYINKAAKMCEQISKHKG